LCAKHQRALALQINRSRKIALLPYVGEREPMKMRR